MRFTDIPANETAKEHLRHMADTDRIPHALLIEGPAGVGKFALARAFAQYVHCTDRTPDGEPCGRCPSCLQHQEFNHLDTIYVFPMLKSACESGLCDDLIPDWHEFLRQSPYMDFSKWVKMLGNENGQPVIYAAEAQDIARKFATSSYSSRYKIMLCWLPERMQPECANKLLKLIEEPYPDSLMVFVSDNASEILPTVRSRLQSVKVNRLPDAEVAAYLMQKHKADPAAAATAAHLAEGSVLAAETHLGKGKEQQKFLDYFMELMRAAYQRKVGVLRKWSGDVATSLGREGMIRFMTYCERMMRENFINNLRMPSLVYLTAEEQAFSSRFSPFINERNVERLLEEFGRAREDIAANGNGKMILFDLAVHVILLLKD